MKLDMHNSLLNTIFLYIQYISENDNVFLCSDPVSPIHYAHVDALKYVGNRIIPVLSHCIEKADNSHMQIFNGQL